MLALALGEGVEPFAHEREKLRRRHLEVVRLHHSLVYLAHEQPVAGLLPQRRGAAVGEEATLAVHVLDHALRLQLGVGFSNGVAVDAQLLGQRTDAGQRLAAPERARRGGGLHLLGELEIDGQAGLEVEREKHGRSAGKLAYLSHDTRTVNADVNGKFSAPF